MNSKIAKYKLTILKCMILSTMICALYFILLASENVCNPILAVLGFITEALFNLWIYFYYFNQKNKVRLFSRYIKNCECYYLASSIGFILPLTMLISTIQLFIP